MEDEQRKKDKPSSREITYQVGWARGKIRSKDGERASVAAEPSAPELASEHDPSNNRQPEEPAEQPQDDSHGPSLDSAQKSRPLIYRPPQQSAPQSETVSEPKVTPGSATLRGASFTYSGLHRESFAERIIWRGLPGIPARWTSALLWAAPIFGFALTYALVLALTRTP